MSRWMPLALMVLLLTTTTALAAAGLQTLPEQLANSSKTAVLVDFYAKWCGWCQKMAPVIKGIGKQSGPQRLMISHIDVDSPANKGLVNQYRVNSVPTYYLYGPNHQLSFVMNGFLDGSVLKTAVLQATNQIPATPPPSVLFNNKPLHWLVVQPEIKAKAFMQKVVDNLNDTVQVHSIALTPDTRVWLSKAHVDATSGAGVLLDKQGRILYRAKASTPERTLRHFIGGFAAGQPG